MSGGVEWVELYVQVGFRECLYNYLEPGRQTVFLQPPVAVQSDIGTEQEGGMHVRTAAPC